MKKRLKLMILLALAIGLSQGFAQQPLSLEVATRMSFPVFQADQLYRYGFGALLRGSLPIGESRFRAGASLGYENVATTALDNLSLISLTPSLGIGVPLGTSVTWQTALGVGGYLGIYGSDIGANPVGRASTGISFAFSPALSLAVEGSYSYYLTRTGEAIGPLYQGAGATIGVSINPGRLGQGSQRRPQLEILDPEFERVFPVFFSYYNDNPLGTVAIRNGESGRIEDVRVSFFVNQFMESPQTIATIAEMASDEQASLDIKALFRDSILDTTEPTTVQAQVTVEYTFRGETLRTSEAYALGVQNRNQITWDDDRKVASFVTAGDPTVLRFSRNIAAAIRETGSTSVNERIRLAMGIFEALKIHGINYVIDPDSSYIELSQDESALDYVQFPQQTLDFRAGDCDDLSILYASLLESVGIRTAFVTIPGHIFTAFALDMDEEEAASTFAREEDLIVRDGEVWFPLEITLVRDDFMTAWATGARQWREADAAGTAGFYPVRQAWQQYTPTAFASTALDIQVPSAPIVTARYEPVLEEFVERQIGPQVAALEERIEASNRSPRLVNRLGTLYARYALYDQAVELLGPLTRGRDPYLPALINLGNIYFLREEWDRALEYYEKAFETRSDDPIAVIGLARTHYEREEYQEARERYELAQVLAPEVAREHSYIVSETSESGRASGAQQRKNVIWDEE